MPGFAAGWGQAYITDIYQLALAEVLFIPKVKKNPFLFISPGHVKNKKQAQKNGLALKKSVDKGVQFFLD